MRQRTLGILAAAFLVAGAALGTGTAIYASRSGVTVAPAPVGQRGPLHHPRFGGPQGQPGFGPGGGARQPGMPGF
ncbi:MAG TPA: hypothetical protein VNF26_11240 [Candidatus Baltobacterales bacterium]|nr:hypothetical protein [Candidatus Baltobacterales bacterium]